MAPATIDRELVVERIGLVFSNGVCLLAEIDGRLVGTVGLLMERASWFTKDTVICDTWAFVVKEYRPLRVFAALMDECRNISKQAGLPLHFQIFTGVETDRKAKLFARHASRCLSKFFRFQPVGAGFQIKGST